MNAFTQDDAHKLINSTNINKSKFNQMIYFIHQEITLFSEAHYQLKTFQVFCNEYLEIYKMKALVRITAIYIYIIYSYIYDSTREIICQEK